MLGVPAMLVSLLLITISGLGWAGLDVLRKLLAGRLATTPLVVLLALGQMPLFVAWAVLGQELRLAPGYLAPGGITIALNVVANLLFVKAIRVSPFSVTIPFLSFTPVFSALFSRLLLGEQLSPAQWQGIALVVAGAFLVNVRHEAGAPRMLHEPGSLLMTGTALLWSVAGPLDKQSLHFASVPVHASLQCGGVGLVLLAVLAHQGRLRELAGGRAAARLLGLALLVSGVALALQFVAIQRVPVGLLEALKRAIGMLSSVIVGRLAFAEPVTAGKAGGIGLMSAGVLLLLV
jgi:drug/metabolite transporter (DMT)-like permease